MLKALFNDIVFMPVRVPLAAYDFAKDNGWSDREAKAISGFAAGYMTLLGVLGAYMGHSPTASVLAATTAIYIGSIGLAANMSLDWPSAEPEPDKPKAGSHPLMKVTCWPHMEAYNRGRQPKL